MAPDITVIIATYNRANDLARTLENMAKTENDDLAVEFIVVDNGSTDNTKSVVGSFSDRISVRYLFEARSGKNRALNTALENCILGEIVVFTDDDVDVSPDWFISIRSVCERWPNHSVFGGRINVVFPCKKVPAWSSDPVLSALGFSRHHYSNEECIYGNATVPFGPNFWVRREIFNNGRRFNEAIGPRPTNRIMGSETTFLIALKNDGYEIVYSPSVIVGHRIQREVLKFATICLRAYRLGRGDVYILGMPQSLLLKKHAVSWLLYSWCAIIWKALKLFRFFILSSNEKRLVNCAETIRGIGFRFEAVRFYRSDRS